MSPVQEEASRRLRWEMQEKRQCVVCKGDMDWPAADSETLFVNPAYLSLYSECQSLWSGGIQAVFVKGTPGIGKSCFLDYVLFRLLTEGKTVLYADCPSDCMYKFYPPSKGGGYEVFRGVFEALTKLDVANSTDVDVVLFDPHENSKETQNYTRKHFFGKDILVAVSPDPENCKKLFKATAESQGILYLGTLSLAEAKQMRSVRYSNSVSEELLTSRYNNIGGVPRYLFPKLLPNGQDSALKQVKQKQEKSLRQAVDQPQVIDGGEVDAAFKHLWSLYFLKPLSNSDGTVDHYNYSIELCGEDVRTRLRDRLMEKEVKSLWALYENTLDQNGTLKGIRFEAYAHKKILAEGVAGIAQSLTTTGSGSATRQFTIPASLPKIVLKDNNLGQPLTDAILETRKNPSGGYLLPHLSNFPVLDSVFTSQNGTVPLQMKAGRSKPLSANAETLFNGLGCFELFFVVPNDITMSRKLGGGPNQLKQFRIILSESS